MDSFFGIGAAELVVILLLAGIVLGPQRIRQVALWLGRMTAQLQIISRGFARQLNEELTALDEGHDVKEAWSEMQDLRRQLAELKSEITSVATQPMAEGRKAVQEAQSALKLHSPQPAEPVNGQLDMTTTQPPRNGSPVAVPRPIRVAGDPE